MRIILKGFIGNMRTLNKYVSGEFCCKLLVVCSFGFFNSVFAAGFNCSGKLTNIEKLICDDQELSILDSSLSDLFNSLKINNSDLVFQQRIWLREKRNLCQTAPCLKFAYGDRIAALKQGNFCSVSEGALQGTWVRTKGEWAFEKMQLSISEQKRDFASWLHDHLEMIGTWKVEQCSIKIKHDTEAVLQYDLRIKNLDNGRLYLFDTDSKSDLIYKLIR